jgi:uncharacterized tellurite resistance protein B-like protein
VFDSIRVMLTGAAPALDSESELRIAVAALLVEAACMDDHFEATERAKIIDLLTQRFDLTVEEAERLLDAGERAEQNSTHIYRFTHLLVEHMSVEQRIEVIEMLWDVAYADGVLDPEEDTLIRKIAGLLYVSDRERGGARRRVLERLARVAG